ncbi:MAG TPA: NAD(P)-binding domain-containing protein [Bacteroidota bacterium]|nr:NAD(P)-binding domain-containing protein [Bacteroidota bacterium]
MKKTRSTIAILGGGNIGMSLARGLVRANHYQPLDITSPGGRNPLLRRLLPKGFM